MATSKGGGRAINKGPTPGAAAPAEVVPKDTAGATWTSQPPTVLEPTPSQTFGSISTDSAGTAEREQPTDVWDALVLTDMGGRIYRVQIIGDVSPNPVLVRAEVATSAGKFVRIEFYEGGRMLLTAALP